MALLGLDTAQKRGIFAGYVLLWVSSHLLVYSSRRAGAPPYNPASVVLLTEAVKLALALSLYFAYDAGAPTTTGGGCAKLAEHVSLAPELPLKYIMPALLYCGYNNLVYANLAALFARRLNRNQWLALVAITLGCVVKEAPSLSPLRGRCGAWMLLLVQMLCSVLAGLYNELLLKDRAGVPTHLQNAYMRAAAAALCNWRVYAASVLCNLLVLLFEGRLGEAVARDNLSALCTPTLLAVVAIMSSVGGVMATPPATPGAFAEPLWSALPQVGVVTGFFLRHLDSVLKAVASALEVVFSMLLSSLLFAVPLTPQAAGAALLVGGGVALYARPPSQPAEATTAQGYAYSPDAADSASSRRE
ncbi:hypothetical protein EMIHUDRAFT_240876 [Emiliania huxleyi CCMP1516]|uniref:Sugar phosphate transporter domain-containing protein n=2 Tax=Emiliania huxleyi TaxID=2903 RepID=A0A0D3JEB0_EMIH1|nr:hypothetical protein EMIHUDRAFT_240876 [Emiliania huxleyi CCMP1516]EOD21845.1 hypothetical protein EMIHUDRAFT_240876 [Emiliania huxleyi CCMP1516]|eukprot:XP_005774274.1 hypothetical protein EMIHUDRAFT_240876 [Emiliania huxleyi CCMP1516]